MHDAKLSRREREAQALYHSCCLVNGAVDKADAPASRNDKNLYAIAQLAAFRLGAQRAIISLVDTKSQYILAEATQTLSPSYDTSSGNDHLLLGLQTLPLSDAFCDHRIFEDPASRHGQVNNNESDHFVSADCQQDERFKEHALVKIEGGVRFAAGVPLVSQNSGTLGALVVLDDSPREKLGDNDIEALREYAKCVMRHLELVHSSVDPSREVSVLRGIAQSFPDRYETQPSGDTNKEVGDTSAHNSENKTNAEGTDRPRSMEDWLLSAFNGIAQTIRQSSLADGVVIFGPHEIASLIVTEGSASAHDAGDSDAGKAPSSVLASYLQEGVTCSAVENQRAPSVRTLRRLASIYPRGMAFDVVGTTATARNQQSDQRRHSYTALAMDHDNVATQEEGDDLDSLHAEVLETLAEAQTLVFLPIYDQEDSTLLAACFFWDASGFRMANGSEDILAYQVLGNFLTHSVAQVRMQNKDAEQSKFMSNFSHELRSPIHGILGAAQFLRDTMTNDHQNALLQSIVVSSNTLLDTLNVVLDYNKFENAAVEVRNPRIHEGASTALSASVQPFYVQADVDLAVLVEDATETVVAGHFFDNLPGRTDPEDLDNKPQNSYEIRQGVDRGTTQDVKVILQIAARPSWSVRTSPGAVSRIIMNLVGNALKFTTTGNIVIELEPKEDVDASKIHVRLKVEDTGVGMTEYFRKTHLFAPYRQENRFAPGVGLGMSVLKHMVSSLHGDITVTSTRGQGTAVNVDLTFEASEDPSDGIPADLKDNLARIKGKHLVLLDLTKMYDGHKPATSVMAREKALRSVATNWLGMRVSTTSDINVPDADFYLFSEPPPANDILEHHQKAAKKQSSNLEIPLIIVTTDSREAHMINRNHAVSLEKTGRIVQVLSQPCGPRKLAKVLNLCQDRVEQSRKERAEKNGDDPPPQEHKPSEAEPETKRDQDGNAEDGEDLERVDGPPSVSAKRPAPKKVSKSQSGASDGHQSDQEEGHDEKEEGGKEEGEEEGRAESREEGREEGREEDREEDKEADSQSRDQGSYQVLEAEDPQPPFSKPLVLARTPTEVQPPKHNDDEKATLHGLCVDDNKINLRLLVTLMRKEKHTYEQAENGQEALDAFKASSGVESLQDESRKPFDFICMDIGMPVMNGIQCTRAIREYERQHSLTPTYIVACTAWGDEQTQREAEEAGMDAFLPKPLKFVHLKEILAGLVKEE